MKSELLHVFAARFNPIRWQTPHDHYVDWVGHMLDSGVKLHVAEVQYGERPFTCNLPGVDHIPLRADSWAWSKENAINLAIQRVPEAKYIAWIDTDVFFRQAHWASETVHALQHYRVLQPWKTAIDLGPDGGIMELHKSFCDVFMNGGKVVPDDAKGWKGPYTFPHPGFGWCCTRELLDWVGGLMEFCGMGSADHHMALSLVGAVQMSFPGGSHHVYKEKLFRWQERVQRFVNGRIGAVPNVIEHRFHGSKPSRGYNSRWSMFVNHQFNPDTDLKRNSFGVLEFAGNKPKLEQEWDRYLRSREEDANTTRST